MRSLRLLLVASWMALVVVACSGQGPSTVVEEPIVEEPVVDEPVVDEPVVEEPVVEEPVVEARVVSVMISTADVVTWGSSVQPHVAVAVEGDANDAVAWSVSDASVAAVDAETGALSVLRVASFDLTATSVFDLSASDTVTITVRTEPQVAVGNVHSVVLDHDGRLHTWVLSSSALDGMLARDPTVAPGRVSAVTNLASSDLRFVQIQAGNGVSVALSDEGVLYSWGRDAFPRSLGREVNANHDQLRPVEGFPVGTRIVDVAFGMRHGVALDELGNVYTWGYLVNADLTSNLLGRPFLDDDAPGVGIVDTQHVTSSITDVEVGDNHTLFITADGTVYTWGSTNTYGNLGRTVTDTTPEGRPHPMTSLSPGTRVVRAAAGLATTFVKTSDGTWLSMGWNESGRLGRSTFGSSDATPAPVGLPSDAGDVTHLSTTGDFVVAQAASGSLYSWGYGPALGREYGLNAIVTTPGLIEGALVGRTILLASAGTAHSVAVDVDGNVYAWGNVTDQSTGVPVDNGRLSRPVGDEGTRRPGRVVGVDDAPFTLRPGVP